MQLHFSRFVLLAVNLPTLLGSQALPVHAQAAEADSVYDYLHDQSCFHKDQEEIADEGCLENAKMHVIRRGGRGVNLHHVYRWRFEDEVASKPLFTHFLMRYLSLLGNAVAAGEVECSHIDQHGLKKGGYSCLTLLLDQLRYMESRANLSDQAIFWNQGGSPNAMAQAETAYKYIGLANVLFRAGHIDEANELFSKSLLIASTLDIIQKPDNGGVRSKVFRYNRGHEAGWLYHSSERNQSDFALNQQAHVIRDTIYYYYLHHLYLDLLGKSMSDETRAQLIDRFLKPLKLLAFAPGDDRSKPGISKFMNDNSQNDERWGFYWSFYKLENRTLKGKNIGAANTCSYHKHVLDVFHGIFYAFKIEPRRERDRALYEFLQNEPNPIHQNMRAELEEVFDALLDAKRGPHGQRVVEPIGRIGSDNALFQFFRSETTSWVKKDALHCSHDDLSSEVYCDYRTLFGLERNLKCLNILDDTTKNTR